MGRSGAKGVRAAVANAQRIGNLGCGKPCHGIGRRTWRKGDNHAQGAIGPGTLGYGGARQSRAGQAKQYIAPLYDHRRLFERVFHKGECLRARQEILGIDEAPRHL